MDKYDQAELRVVEVHGSAPARQTRRPAPAVNPPAPTSAEALESLRSMKGAASVFERLPGLANVKEWDQLAFWSVRESTGAAFDPYFWDADFMNGFSMGFGYTNGVVTFWGTESVATNGGIEIVPPQTLTGQVWCDMKFPGPGHYLFAAHVGANGDPPDYEATVEFSIDDVSLGNRQLHAAGPHVQYFLIGLTGTSAGVCRFAIKQVSGIFHFRTVTAWSFPVSHP